MLHVSIIVFEIKFEPMTKSATYWVNGAFVSADEATLSIEDVGILRGYGVFDYLRSYDGKPYHLMDHLNAWSRFFSFLFGLVYSLLVKKSLLLMGSLLVNSSLVCGLSVNCFWGKSTSSITQSDSTFCVCFALICNLFDKLCVQLQGIWLIRHTLTTREARTCTLWVLVLLNNPYGVL